jgi:2-polyprenyl-3-methyl-5-hydroxy-6-metoxy-1,4-benzoquinol methylase
VRFRPAAASQKDKIFGGNKVSFDCYDPHGAAALDYFNGDTSAAVTVHTEGRKTKQVPMSIFFRTAANLLPLEDVALELAVKAGGRVLDVGAGSGCHSLILQERGAEVCAVDIVPVLVEVMKRRGVRDARCADILEFSAPAFDTILMLMNGAVMLEKLERMAPFLRHLRSLTKPTGQLLLHTADLRRTTDPAELARLEACRQSGRYFGEVATQLEYKGKKGAPFTALMVDPETLEAEAGKAGWSSEVLGWTDGVGYLARLKPLR